MKTLSIITTFYLSLVSLGLLGQHNLQDKVDNLKSVSDMPYICRDTIDTGGCGQTAFWTVVTEQLDIIPYLLHQLDDTTKTEAYVPYFGGKWTVADVAYSAIQEIINDIPTFAILGVPFDTDGCGYCAYWNHLRRDVKNRQEFKANVTKWYHDNKDKLIWVDSNKVLTCDCSFKHPNGGHYKVKN